MTTEIRLALSTQLEAGSYAQVGGIRTHYHLAGTGAQVVFIHGSGPGVSAWANWRLALPALQDRFMVAALDVVGFGYTERPVGFPYGVQSWTDHVISFIEGLGQGPVNLVGNSMGGGLALQIARRRPELVRRMVLMGTMGCQFEITAGLEKVWGYRPGPARMLELLNLFLYNKNLATPELAELRYRASVQPGFQESWEEMFAQRPQAAAGTLQWRVDDLALADSQIAALDIPTLVIHGREDQIIPVENAYKVFDLLQKAELHIFGQCGHWSQIEQAATFNRLVADFFDPAP